MPENSSCSSSGSCTKSSCEGCSSNKGPQSFIVEQNKYSNIKHVIGVVSGKGGVGKSFVTSSLAVNMAKQGYKVGILDADITGPSIPKMFGAHEQVVGDENGNMIPFETPAGYDIVEEDESYFDLDTDELLLGDIMISVPKVFAQAEEYGHSVTREFCFLVAHSMLHLLGYDHMTPGEAAVMEAKQAKALEELGITR